MTKDLKKLISLQKSMTSDDSFHSSETDSSISEQPLKSKSFSLLNSKISSLDYFYGLKNPSHFCYLNSYLQVLIHVPAFGGMILNQQDTNNVVQLLYI
jgi:ubiquitin C-terminal hydrolase